MRYRAAFAAVLLVLGGVSCASGGSPTDGGKPLVVTTVSPITNIAQNVGGDQVTITGVVPEGENSHEFEPAPSDARLMAEADIVFMNGLHLEEPTLELAESNVREGVKIVKLGDETITPDQYIYDFSFPKEAGDPNPHLWTNPPYAKRYAEIVRDELSALDPDGAQVYAGNYEKFATRLDALDEAVRTATGTVPETNRKLLTYHDSFPYFAREYGWKIIGAIQPSDFSEPSPREVADLIDQIRREKVPAIFGSEVFPSPVLQTIAKETGATYVDDLRDDDLPGDPGGTSHSYLGLMVFDYRTFITALGGNASAFDGFDVSNVAGEGSATYRE
jgi:ABC-type Zn uptake system ZnuABC Zn-binding protein ZnuA